MSEQATKVEQIAPNSNAITTSVVLNLSKEAVLAHLNDFETLIELNLLVRSFTPLNPATDEPSSPSYQIVDQLKIFGVTFLQRYAVKLTMACQFQRALAWEY